MLEACNSNPIVQIGTVGEVLKKRDNRDKGQRQFCGSILEEVGDFFQRTVSRLFRLGGTVT